MLSKNTNYSVWLSNKDILAEFRYNCRLNLSLPERKVKQSNLGSGIFFRNTAAKQPGHPILASVKVRCWYGSIFIFFRLYVGGGGGKEVKSKAHPAALSLPADRLHILNTHVSVSLWASNSEHICMHLRQSLHVLLHNIFVFLICLSPWAWSGARFTKS